MHPDVDKQKCNSCGNCASQCPTGAIDMQNPKLTDGKEMYDVLQMYQCVPGVMHAILGAAI